MADPTGIDPKPNEGNPSEERAGPVKPPVLDMKARDAAGLDKKAGEESTKPADASPPKSRPEPTAAKRPVEVTPKSPERDGKKTGGFAFGAAIAGGVLGLAVAYGLAWAGLWPAQPVPAPDPRLEQYSSAIAELRTTLEATQSDIAELDQRLVSTEEAAPLQSAEPVDLEPIQTAIAELRERVSTLAESAPEADATPEALEPLRADLQSAVSRLDEVAARLGTAEAELRSLDSAVSEATAALSDQPEDLGAVLQLPLILSGLESAFSTGRTYEVELAQLRSALPQVEIPATVANAAAIGLPRPDAVAQRFNEVLPAMLAGRPADAEAGWQQGALDWFSSAVALRPTGEVDGDEPSAVVSRLEGAIERRDFDGAEELLSALPQPMIAAAGDVPILISMQADANRFLEAVRTQVITGDIVP